MVGSCMLLHLLSSEHNLTLSVLFLSEDEGLGSLDDSVALGFGLSVFKLEHNLLGLLCLLSENGLGLSTKAFLFHIVSPLSLGGEGIFAFFVLSDFVNSVAFCLPAVSSNLLWDMYHFAFCSLSN